MFLRPPDTSLQLKVNFLTYAVNTKKNLLSMQKMLLFVCVDALSPSQQFLSHVKDVLLSLWVEPVLSRG